jgi:hypothetical protein
VVNDDEVHLSRLLASDMRLPTCLCAALLALSTPAFAKSAFGQSVLVVLDGDRSEGDYSRFLGSLRGAHTLIRPLAHL